MNKLIFRKLSYDILLFFLLSTTALTLIIWVIQAVNLLDIISEDGHGIKVYFLYSILNIPNIFSKLIVFTFFLTLFVVLNRYETSNEILLFWTNGIKKITFINFIGKISFLFVIFQLTLTLLIVPYTQNLSQIYLKSSSLEFFPKLIQEKKFSNIVRNLTIFIEKYNNNEILEGIYIKEKINDNESKIIIANKGEIINQENEFGFKLLDGKIITINKKDNYSLGFNETTYNLSKFDSRARSYQKLDEINSLFLLNCLESFLSDRKKSNISCDNEKKYFLNEIYQEFFKRIINPFYIIILSLISSLIILKTKLSISQNSFKFILFLIGFSIIIFSQLSYKFIFNSFYTEILFLILPMLLIFIFYFFISLKSKFKISYL